MLRINVNDGGNQTSLVIEGKLMGPWVKALESCWQTVATKMPERRLEVNLAAVTFVDDDGRELLAQMCRQGVIIIPNGLLMKAIVEEIEARVGTENGQHSNSNAEC
jgi:hypothetical protein